ncbi:hypothetical protein [Saccharibacillus alkalitolerans]|uniref:Uncharacterized protein n=1 Tax=Saccharibacillus alkalitolerans TaxID=2705290 RepID=A0ABX0F6P2_9BACL|nr:hypothetical protein [Saccharibacillus alkalitolerans]NGZ76628.1 hypothetical protein [Saccharibacillus alkalitolerans]
MWTPYEARRGHPHDFRVRYRFYTEEEGGRRSLPYQGYRSDFAYDGDDISQTGIYAIHPEFEDADGEVWRDDEGPVSREGTARMWILFPAMRREVHAKRIAVGIKGFFMEGSRRVGEMEAIEICGLAENAETLAD